MATGDMKNNLKKLQKQASLTRYPHDLDYEGLTKGDVRAHLPILYHIFFDYNSQVLESLIKMNYNLAGKKDASFMNMVYKILREKGGNCNMKLKVGQFMSTGFAERKVIMTTSIIEFVRKYFKLSSAGKTKIKSTAAHSNHNADVEISSLSVINTNTEPHHKVSPPDPQQPATLTTAPRMQSTVRGDLSFVPLPGFGTSAIAPLESTIVQRHIARDGPLKIIPEKHDKPREVIPRIIEEQPTETINGKEQDSEDFASQLVTMRIRQDALEKENQALKSTIDSMRKEIMILSNEFRALEERPQHVQSEEVMARLDILESKIAVIENSTSNHPPHSPVCGSSLCSNMKNLNIQHTPADVSQVTESNERSLLDVTNDSPIHHIRMQERNLFKSVQITRTLLGIGDVSGIDSTNHSDNEQQENETPEEQSIS